MAKQLAARLVFLSTLIILLPLAVLNRQTVSIALNPMDLLRDVPHGRLEMPLFIALFALFILGLLAGWLMGRLGQNRRRRATGLARASGTSGSPATLPTSPTSPSRRAPAVVIDKAQIDDDTPSMASPLEESDEAHAR
ncbi:LapA family protein [Alphaproteobacteria bacterium]|nr:LapA family protein [Alphaproteobacteria bacterium]MDA8539445.1 LapA family protein [Alphaproteobacteria bacterium]MDA8625223.1 LapA family protein [Alphaproteobacteria bacterium]MDB2406388.1 LapA family protein [Alphaproteobacteria bacterium]MDB2432074.1 LapA family protein [Alphaproteobacteria bacterium]